MKRVLLAAVAVLVSAVTAHAATLESVNGNVKVNRGAGFQPVVSGATLKAGDMVMAAPGASAKLSYSGGCKITVAAGAVVAVRKYSPCVAGLRGYVGNHSTKERLPFLNEVPRGAIVVGGLVIVGGIAVGIILANDDDDDNPASP
ncbi:MAG: hypothetical protein AAFR04_05500 [Pseudomonadota bacterium]